MIESGRFHWGRPRHPDNQAVAVSWGNIFYRGAAGLAALIAVLAIGNYLYNVGENRPLVPFVPLLVAGVIWLIGYGLRYFINDR
jgi:hypothetical protein